MSLLFNKNKTESHDFWISYTDLTFGLLLIFIVVCFVGPNQNTDNPINNPNEGGDLIHLSEEFKEIFEDDSYVEIRSDIGSIRVYPDTTKKPYLFAKGQDTLEYDFRGRLRQFGSDFIERAESLGMIIQEIRIEGHTDSDNTFLYNLDLSSRRAHRVYSFIYDSCELNDNQQQFMEQKIIAVGYSESQLLDSSGQLIKVSQGKEDEEKSRRIEFRIIGKVKK